jgi:hypothetical protein
MRLTLFCLLFFLSCCFAAGAQPDTVTLKANPNLNLNKMPLADSAALSDRQQFIADSIAMFYLIPDSSRENQFLSRTWKNNLLDLSSQSSVPVRRKSVAKSGVVRTSRDPWVIAVIIGLLIYTALLNLFLGKDIRNVIQSFYTKNALSQVDKEGGLVNSWAFVGLFLLFCLTASLVLYQFTVYENIDYGIDGFQFFMLLSLIIGVLFALKFIILKFIGFVFAVNRLVSEYIAILNLTYFNIAFVLLFVALCFSLLANRFIPWLLIFTVGSIAVIFAVQYLRNSINVISNFRFHKFYLFIYLCALEICPILILIKALNI